MIESDIGSLCEERKPSMRRQKMVEKISSQKEAKSKKSGTKKKKKRNGESTKHRENIFVSGDKMAVKGARVKLMEDDYPPPQDLFLDGAYVSKKSKRSV